MGQSVAGELRAEIRRIVAEGRRVDVIVNAGTIAARLYAAYPEAGLTALDIHAELLSAAADPANPAGEPAIGIGI